MRTLLLSLFLTLALLVPQAFAEAFTLRVPATSASGFIYENGGPQSLQSCAFAVQYEDGHLVLAVLGPLERVIGPQLIEELSLPLSEGVIPTFQIGLNLSYENSLLTVHAVHQNGLFMEERKLELDIDSMLKRPVWAKASLRISGGFPPVTGRERELLECRF